MSDIELEGGKKCKSYQRRSKATGHCRNVGSPSRSRSRSMKWTRNGRGRMVRGGEIASEVEIQGGDVSVEGGAKVPCKKYQKRSKTTGKCRNVLARMSKTMRMSKTRSSRSRRMAGGEVELEGGEVELEGGEGEVEGGKRMHGKRSRKGKGRRSRSRRM